MEQRKKSSYFCDLGAEWKKYTGLPFVFAALVSNKKLDEDFIAVFNKANLAGLSNIDDVVEENYYPVFNLKDYYTKYISYNLDDPKKEGLALFLNKLKAASFADIDGVK